MQIDPRGRVRNMTLPPSKALLPVFEAIINSFQAIDERQVPESGFIDIYVERSDDLEDKASRAQKELRGDIAGFTITDNGEIAPNSWTPPK